METLGKTCNVEIFLAKKTSTVNISCFGHVLRLFCFVWNLQILNVAVVFLTLDNDKKKHPAAQRGTSVGIYLHTMSPINF